MNSIKVRTVAGAPVVLECATASVTRVAVSPTAHSAVRDAVVAGVPAYVLGVTPGPPGRSWTG